MTNLIAIHRIGPFSEFGALYGAIAADGQRDQRDQECEKMLHKTGPLG